MTNRFHSSVRDELDEKELQLAKEIDQLDQQCWNSRNKLKTEPVDQPERRVLQIKPSTNCNNGYSSRGFKVSQLKVQHHVSNQPQPFPTKKPIRHQFSSLIMGRTTAVAPAVADKENRPFNTAATKPGGSKKAPGMEQPQKKQMPSPTPPRPPVSRPPAKQQSHPHPSLCRNLMKDFEPEHLFDPQQDPESNRLFQDDSLLLDYDSLEFDIKEEPEQNSEQSGELTKQLRKQTQSTNGKFTKRGHSTLGQELECTFKPAILHKSKQIAEKLRPSFDRLTTRQKKPQQDKPGYRETSDTGKRYSRERINTLSRPKQLPCQTQREEESCSFKPVLSKKSLKQFNQCDLNVIDRNQLWLQQKEDKITKLREEEERVRITREEANSQRLSVFVSKKTPTEMELSKFEKEGLASYFERLQQASEMKRRAQEFELKYSGRGWNGNITKTQEFRLSGLEKQKVRPKTPNKSGEKEYQRAIKELHEKIQKLQL